MKDLRTLRQITLAVGLLWLNGVTSWAEADPQDLLSTLQQKDREQLSLSPAGFTVSFVMETEASLLGPDQGRMVHDCTAAWTADSRALKGRCHYDHPPRYREDAGSVDYDPEGNLILWRTVEVYAISTPQRNEALHLSEMWLVGPDGEIRETVNHSTLYHYSIGSSEGTYQLDQLRSATGRGFASRIESITEVDSSSSNLLKVLANGSHGGFEGQWDLLIDSDADYLVRQARFTIEGGARPLVEISNSGTVEVPELKIAEYGVIRGGIYETTFTVTALSSTGASDVFNEIIARLEKPLPSGAVISDYRGGLPPVQTDVE